jgi:hypothetical protein
VDGMLQWRSGDTTEAVSSGKHHFEALVSSLKDIEPLMFTRNAF